MSQCLVILPGISQTPWILACAQEKIHSHNKIFAISTNAAWRGEIEDRIYDDVCKLFNVFWCGNHPLSSTTRREFQLLDSGTDNCQLHKREVIEKVLGLNPFIKAFDQFNLVTTVKSCTLQDFLIANAMKCKRAFLVTDGIFNHDLKVDRTKSSDFSTKDPLCVLPSDENVWCPAYLSEYARNVGKPKIISSSLLTEYEKRISRINYMSQVQKNFNTNKDSLNGIVLSQHFSLSGFCDKKSEILYYLKLSQFLFESGATKVFWKPHPRDEINKYSEIRELMESERKKSFLNLDSFGLCPIEQLEDLSECIVIGSNSTGLLAVRNKVSKPLKILCADSRFLGKKLSGMVVKFSHDNDLPLINIPNN